MKPITIHPLSALLGAAVLAVPLVLMSAQSEIVWPRQVPIPVTVQEMPDPQDMITIRQVDGPFVVPEGKTLVLTGLGTRMLNGDVQLYADGEEVMKHAYVTTANPCSVAHVPVGLTFPAGTSITMTQVSAETWGVALGYLVDA